MAASKDLLKVRQEGKLLPFPVKTGTKIYAGTFVAVDATGYAVPLAANAAHRFIGVADAQADNLLGADGAINVMVWREGCFEFPATSIAITSVGASMYGVHDAEMDESNGGNMQIVGTLVGYISATRGVVDISTAIRTPESTTSGDALTVSDAGAFFAAAKDTLVEQMQVVAGKPIVITIPRFTGWTKDGADKTPALPLLELPIPVRIKRAYLNLGTAPGADKTLVLDVNGTQAISIAGTDTQAEDEALDIAIAADTNIVVTANETAGGAGANADLILIAVMDDGE